MTIWDLCDNEYEVDDDTSLEKILGVRHPRDANCFLMSPSESRFPCLEIMVRSQLAYLTYTASADGRSSFSKGDISHSLPGETTSFAISPYEVEDLDVQNYSVVPFAAAVAAAKEFLHSQQLPKSIEWESP